MNNFVTTIKTDYTNVPVFNEKKTFVTPYSSKKSERLLLERIDILIKNSLVD